MTDQTIVRCEQCGQVYTARVNEGRFVLPTDDARCACGSRAFEDVTDAEDGEEAVEDGGAAPT